MEMDLSYLWDGKVILGRLTNFLISGTVTYFWTHTLVLDAHTLKSFNWSSTLLNDMISKFEVEFLELSICFYLYQSTKTIHFELGGTDMK